jgi:hypothetical protein
MVENDVEHERQCAGAQHGLVAVERGAGKRGLTWQHIEQDLQRR